MDFNGNKINIGDTVIYAYGGTSLIKGSVVEIKTDKFKRTIITIKDDTYGTLERRKSENVILLN